MKVIILYLFFLIINLAHANNELNAKKFMEASNLFNNGKYDQAISQFLDLSNKYPKSGELYYNLGNTYFKNGELGKSIFYYLKAKKLLPRNGDIKFNLKYARSQKLDKQDSTHDLFDVLDIPFNGDELLLLSSIFSIIFWGLIIIVNIKKNFILSTLRYVSLVILLLLGTTFILHKINQSKIAVVTSEESSIFSTTGVNSVKLFTLHQGSELIILNKKNNWALITLGGNQKGWIPLNNIIQ